MTLVEFIAPLKKASVRDKVLAILYFQDRYASVSAMTVEQIRSALRNARVKGVKKINVADVLAKSGHFVDTNGLKGNRRLWKLTDSGKQHIRSTLGLPEAEPEVEHDVAALTALVAKLHDHTVRSFIDEAIVCLQVGALRASTVFLWSGTIRTIQGSAIARGVSKLNTALATHDPKGRHVGKIDDFAYIKDALTLLVAQDLGIIDKGERTTLEEALNLRNRCGHPTKYKPGVKKVSSYIEDIVGIVFK